VWRQQVPFGTYTFLHFTVPRYLHAAGRVAGVLRIHTSIYMNSMVESIWRIYTQPCLFNSLINTLEHKEFTLREDRKVHAPKLEDTQLSALSRFRHSSNFTMLGDEVGRYEVLLIPLIHENSPS
jgi:hypothetical protein